MKKQLFLLLLPITLFTLLLTSCSDKQSSFKLEKVAESDQLWTGVAASNDGRVFVNYPRWIPNIEYSVAELKSDNEVIPYPDKKWNSFDGENSPEDHFVCVQSVYIDDKGFLWVLDTGMLLGRGVIENGAKLIKINLETNEVIDKIFFDDTIAFGRCYLNDVRVDTKNDFAFITDSGVGAVIVVNLDTKLSRRLLENHPSTKAEDIVITIHGEAWLQRDSSKPQIHSDGIALDKNNEFIYYQALTGHNLYRIPVDKLEDFSIVDTQLDQLVEHVIKSGPADGIMFDRNNLLFLSSLDESAIRYIDENGNIIVAYKSVDLEWPDSFSITANGDIYFTDSKLNKAYQPDVKYIVYKLVRE
ncbi:L-dopachrome tautomerase-related protein [Bacteroidota bacterium]